MKTYDVYGIGAALVDIEFKVDDDFLEKNQVDKGIMTLVDEEKQHQLIANLGSHSELIKQIGRASCRARV